MDLSKIAWNYSVLKTVPKDNLPVLMVRTSHYHITNVLEDIFRCIEDTYRENPEYQQVYFDDNDCRDFISDCFPEYLSDYDVVIPGAYKADLFRILFLYYYGGIYNDSSQRYLVHVKDLVEPNGIVLVNDLDQRGFFNAFMSFPKEHPLIKKMIDVVIDNIRNRFYGDSCLDPTGPHALRKAFLEYYSLPDDFDLQSRNEYLDIKLYHFTDYQFIYRGSERIIKIKFDYYHQKVYTQTGKIKYADAWVERKIYSSQIGSFPDKMSGKPIWNYSEFKKNYQSQTGIPKIMVRTSHYKLEDLPKEIHDLILETADKNPEYQQIYFDDLDSERFIMDYFPQYLPEYRVLKPGAFKADLFRLLFLYRIGGIYNDSGHKYLVPVSQLIEGEIVLCFDRWNEGIYNAFMASIPRHPILRKLIDSIVDNIRNRRYGKNPLDITGPAALKRAILEYFSLPEETWIPNNSQIKEVTPYHHVEQEGYIGDNNSILVLKTKTDNYMSVMYSNRLHYHEMWCRREVFT